MLVAGMAQQWDELVLLDQERSIVLKKSPIVTTTDAPLALIQLIHEIQECDAQLREKVGTWMAHARILLRFDALPPP